MDRVGVGVGALPGAEAKVPQADVGVVAAGVQLMGGLEHHVQHPRPAAELLPQAAHTLTAAQGGRETRR